MGSLATLCKLKCELNYLLNLGDFSMAVKEGWLRPVILAHTLSENISEAYG